MKEAFRQRDERIEKERVEKKPLTHDPIVD